MASLAARARAMVEGSEPHPPVLQLIGARLVACDDGESRVELEAGERHHNPMGTLHGGIVCDIADAAMGLAYASMLDEGESFTTLELKVNYVRPFWEGRLVAEAQVVEAGRTVAFVACDVRDVDGRLIAHASSTCLRLAGEAAEGR